MSKERFEPKSKVRKGDKVIVVAGASKSSEPREVLEVLTKKQRVVLEGVRVNKKHLRPTNEAAGGIVDVPAPIHISNVMVVDPKSGEPTRVGFRKEDGKSVRYSKKTGETI